MKKWVLVMIIFCSSCATFKEKRRLQSDSLLKEHSSLQWLLQQQLKSTTLQTKEGIRIEQVLIHSDAPFTWKADSGLIGKAGNYQLYLIRKEKALSSQVQVTEEKTSGASKQNKTRIRKQSEAQKTVSKSTHPTMIVFGLLTVLLVILYLRWKRSVF